MDWYEWLRRAGLGEDLAAEYALLFARNELGAADVRHLDHAFLATMGVAVAKHRLEILKLARRESSASAAITVLPWRATRLLAAAAQRSARSLAGCLRSAARRGRSKAAVAPRPLALCHQGVAGPARWKGAPTAADGRGVTKRKLAALLARVGKPMHTLTNSAGRKGTRNSAAPTTYMATAIAAGCFTSTETCGSDYDADDDEDEDAETDDGGGEDPETPWESMFEDLKPT
ncbi:uncharacterized protein LOC125520889 [Triticum urartu]|uniref:SAM domain-containing protein n=2 Tax=Triticum TaxID=4564 RepID=A0A3B6REA5_WHEAT|nr:uncharacterized protein LOC119328071 [Triticum dicoccoides]XP_044425872.1 uncharacterized protein LOC123150137 [Triticum aestivum]XP_048541887.1 uncharacterized protein LOC125520889 [Triticum urartu]